MPFVSEKQRRYLWANEPEVAREFAEHTPKGKKLPMRKKKKKEEHKAASILDSIEESNEEKSAIAWALGERPATANGHLVESSASNGGQPSYGREAWDSVTPYMPSNVLADNKGSYQQNAVKTAGGDREVSSMIGSYGIPAALGGLIGSAVDDNRLRGAMRGIGGGLGAGAGLGINLNALDLDNKGYSDTSIPADKGLLPTSSGLSIWPGVMGGGLIGERLGYGLHSLGSSAVDKAKKLFNRSPTEEHEEKTAEDSDTADGQTNQGPPNYKPGMPGHSCNSCSMYDAVTGSCNKYAVNVRADYVCDDFEPKESKLDTNFSDQSEPIKPIGSTQSSSSLEPDQAFKFGFMMRCAEEGLSLDQTTKRAETILTNMEKQAILPALAGIGGLIAGGLSGAGHILSATPGLAAMAAVPLLGVPTMMGRYVADTNHANRKAQADEFRRNNQLDTEDLKTFEVSQAYNQERREALLRHAMNKLDEVRRTAPVRRKPVSSTISPGLDLSSEPSHLYA